RRAARSGRPAGGVPVSERQRGLAGHLGCRHGKRPAARRAGHDHDDPPGPDRDHAPVDRGPQGGRSVTTRAATTDRGFALVAVLLVLGLLGLVGAEFAYSMRLEAMAARSYKEGIVAAHLAEAAVEQAIREIVADSAFVVVDDQGVLTFHGRDGRALTRLPRTRVPLGTMGAFSYRISDEEARLNLNTSPPDRFDHLLQGLGVTKGDRDTINDSLQDWRDANDDHRLNGAESDDYYLKLPIPYRAHNANLESVSELLQIKGVKPEIYYGREGK